MNPRLKLTIFIITVLALPYGGVALLSLGSAGSQIGQVDVPAIRNATLGWNAAGNLVVCSPPTSMEIDCSSMKSVRQIDPLLVWPIMGDEGVYAEKIGDFRNNGLRYRPGDRELPTSAGGLLLLSRQNGRLVKMRERKLYLFSLNSDEKVVRREFSFAPQPSMLSLDPEGKILIADTGWDSFEMVVSMDLAGAWKENPDQGSFQSPLGDLLETKDGWSQILRVRARGVAMDLQGRWIAYMQESAPDSGKWSILVRSLADWSLREKIDIRDSLQGRLSIFEARGSEGEIIFALWPGQGGNGFFERMRGMGRLHCIWKGEEGYRISDAGLVALSSWGAITPSGSGLVLVHPGSGRVAFHDLEKMKEADNRPLQ